LRDLHQRAFEPAQRRGQRTRLAGAVRLAAQKPPAGIARRDATYIRRNAGIARGAGGKAILFAVGLFALGHKSLACYSVAVTRLCQPARCQAVGSSCLYFARAWPLTRLVVRVLRSSAQ